MYRKHKLVNGEIYHIINKSIADFKIFNNAQEFLRMKRVLKYYTLRDVYLKFSKYHKTQKIKNDKSDKHLSNVIQNEKKLVHILAYCLMPTHIHLILKQVENDGISNFMRRILNSYTRYFNIKHNRKGPLWEGRFKSILVETYEQLLHLTRYIHLNPVTAYLIDNPEMWPASSLHEYISERNITSKLCEYIDILEIDPESYKRFVYDGISYQRDLAKAKTLSTPEVGIG